MAGRCSEHPRPGPTPGRSNVDEPTCNVYGCTKKARTVGMCLQHYHAQRVANLPEECAVPGCDRRMPTGGVACRQHARQLREGKSLDELKPIKAKKVVRRYVDDCIANRDRSTCWIDWPWATQFGRPRMYHYGIGPYADKLPHQINVARYVVYVETGEWPEYACHRCPGGDDERCWNPDHLYAGTPASNIEDMRRQQRGNFSPDRRRRWLTWGPP